MYTETECEQVGFGHQCPNCKGIVHEIRREVLVNGDDNARDEWGDHPHVTFVCHECGHTWELVYSHGPWEVDFNMYLSAGGQCLPEYLIYHELAGERPIGKIYGARHMPSSGQEALARYINGVDPFMEMNENFPIGVAKPHGNGASVIVPRKYLGTRFLLIPIGGE